METLLGFTDSEVVTHSDVVVEDDVRAFVTHGPQFLDLNARRSHGNKEHRQPSRSPRGRVTTGQEEAVVSPVGERGEHLLPVDHPLVAVTYRAGLAGEDVGAALGLRVPQANERLPRGDPGEYSGLQRRRAQ